MLKDWVKKAENFWEHEKKEIAIQIGQLKDTAMVYLVVLEQKYEDWQVKHHQVFKNEAQAQKYAKTFMMKN